MHLYYDILSILGECTISMHLGVHLLFQFQMCTQMCIHLTLLEQMLFLINISDNFFLNSTMARKLKQIDRLIDHTGAYFQEEMQQIVSITSNF